LQGQLIPQNEDSVIINVRGVGYEVWVSNQTMIGLSGLNAAKQPAQVQMWVHTHVREDSLQLFGFVQKAEKELFLSLLKVNGIGPKVAMKILSGAPLNSLIQMIEESDVRGLSKLPKVGKKTAEQIILALKGKLALGDEQTPKLGFAARADIISALVNLGFKLQDVEKTVDQFEPTIDFEEGVKRGLGSLATL
jgi:Holliday junction DNA helicase RuvA